MNNKGQTLIELLITIGLSAILIPALLVGFSATRNGRAQQEQRLQATSYFKEAQEAIRIIVANNWDNLINGTYHPVVSGSTWALAAGPETISGFGFTRQIGIGDVYRDSNSNIVISGGILDPSTKHIVISVSWTNPIASSVSTDSYLTRHKNTVFSASDTAQPPAGGHGDWCNPNLNINSYDVSGNGVAIAVSSFPGAASGNPNKAYLSTGNNASSYSLYSLSISDPAFPASPSATTANTYNNGKNYGIFANSDYVFVAAGNVPGAPKRLVDIINAATLTRVGFFDSNSNMTSYSVYVSGTTGYVTANTSLIAFNASPVNGTSSQSQSWIKSLNSNATGNKVVVSGGYAYIATSATSNSQQLQVVKLSDQSISSPPSTGTGSINTNQPGVDLTVQDNYAYLVTNYSSSNPDIFVIDISTPSVPKVVGTASTFFNSTSMNPLGVATTTIPNNVIIIVVGNGGWQYQVFQVSQSGSVSRCPVTPLVPNAGALQNPNGATKIQAVSALKEQDGDAYSYILTTNGSSQQFQIIEGGTGSGGSGNGIFESTTFDAGRNVAFNYFSATIDSNLSYKLAIKQAVGGACPTFVDGDFISISTGPIVLPGVGYSNPGQCLRYRVINSGSTAIPYTVNINYSP